jgi:hypothetical protein
MKRRELLAYLTENGENKWTGTKSMNSQSYSIRIGHYEESKRL